MRGVNGALIDVLGQVELPVKLSGLILYHTFSIIPNLYTNAILGHDFLLQNDAQIDFKRGLLTLKDGITSVAMITKQPSGNPVLVQKETIIAPYTQCVIPVHIPKLSQGCDSVIQPNPVLAKQFNLLGSKCVVNAQKSTTVPYLLMNPTTESVVLSANFQLATAYPVEDVKAYDAQEPCTQDRQYNSTAPTSPFTTSTVAAAEKINTKQLRETAETLGISFEQSTLTADQQNRLLELIGAYRDVFATADDQLGRCDIFPHTIDTGNAKPITQRFYRQTPLIRDETNRQIKSMLEKNIIKPSNTIWTSPVVLVKKANGSYRFAIDYRQLNKVTKPLNFPLPRIDDLLDSVGQSGATLFTPLDLRSGYHQIALDPATAHKTGFITSDSVYEFVTMPFGLCSAGSTFQMTMSQIFRSMTYRNVLVYLDDVLVFSCDFGTHMQDLEEVFQRLRKANLKLSPEKCIFAAKHIKFLGHMVSAEGIRVNPEKTKALATYPAPKNVKQLRTVLGSFNYFRKFIKNYAARVAPLTALLKEDKNFVWTNACQVAFDDLKTALTTSPILAYPNFNETFTLSTDASLEAIGFMLEQPDRNGQMRPIAYGGRALRAHERKYNVSEQECLAVIEGIRTFHHYLADKRFDIFSDHHALKWLMNTKLSTGRLARWSLQLQPYQFRIFHRPGCKNKVPDALSRRHYEPQDETVPEKPDALAACAITEDNQLPTQATFEYVDQIDDDTESPLCAIELELDSETAVPEDIVFAIGDDLQEAQRNSKDFKPILQYLEDGELPTDPKLARKIVAESQYYIIVDGLLYHLFYHGSRGIPKGDRLVRQLAVPESYRAQALEAFHDSLAGGAHAGIERTYHHLRTKYYWPQQWEAVYKHVQSCHECQQAKRNYQSKPAPLKPLKVTEVFHRWHVDILGPLTETEKKEKYVLVLIDSFSKWCEAYPLKSQSSLEIKDCLFDCFARFGAPSCLVSDRGANFLSKIVASLCELFQVKRVFTSSYHPQTNAQVERANAIIGQSLRTYLDAHQNTWSSYLPGIMMAYRAAPATHSHQHSPLFSFLGEK